MNECILCMKLWRLKRCSTTFQSGSTRLPRHAVLYTAGGFECSRGKQAKNLPNQNILVRNSIRMRHLVKTVALWRHEKHFDGLLLKQFSESVFTARQKNVSFKTKSMKMRVKLNRLLFKYVNAVGNHSLVFRLKLLS